MYPAILSMAGQGEGTYEGTKRSYQRMREAGPDCADTRGRRSAVLVRVLKKSAHMIVEVGKSKICRVGQQPGELEKSQH